VLRVDGAWVLVLAAGDRAIVYRSSDLKSWTRASEIGPFAGVDGTWECPDLFLVDGRWVFKVDLNAGLGEPGSKALAWLGAFDGTTFTADGDAQLLDHGPDFYAAQSFSNAPGGRVVWTAWSDNWLYALGTPTEPWRGSLTVPRDVRVVDGAIVQRPAPELGALRDACAFDDAAGFAVDGTRDLPFAGDALDVEVVLEPSAGAELGLELRVADPETTKVGYDAERGVVFVDRTESGDATFHPGFAGRYEAPLPLRDGKIALRVLVDRSSIEVFADDGRAVLTVNVYPRPIAVAARAFGAGRIPSLRAWRMKDAIVR
jgi:fructan beta-fructosidase